MTYQLAHIGPLAAVASTLEGKLDGPRIYNYTYNIHKKQINGTMQKAGHYFCNVIALCSDSSSKFIRHEQGPRSSLKVGGGG